MDVPPRNSKAGPKKGRPAAIDKKLPHSGLYAPTRPARYREKRYLTEEQRRVPLIRTAFKRLSEIDKLRGQYLRELDTVHGGRRTRSEKFVTLAKAAEQILVRLDLATGVLGWLDVDKMQYCLSTQCNVAEDSDIAPSVFCRLLHTMERADYVYLRSERVRLEEKDENGLHMVRTRMLVRFTEKFFADLGVRYLWFRAKKAARKKREQQLLQISGAIIARQERASIEELRRQESRMNWERSQARQAGHGELEASNASLGGPEPPREPDRGPVKPDELLANVMAKYGKTPPSK